MAEPIPTQPVPAQPAQRRNADPEMEVFLDRLSQHMCDEMDRRVERLGQEILEETANQMALLEQKLQARSPLDTVPLDEVAPLGSVNEAVARNDLAVQLFYGNELERAAQLLEEATRERPDFVEAWNNLAMVYSALNRTGKAVDAFSKAAALAPDRVELINNKAVLTMLKGNPGDALTLLEEASQNHAHDIGILLNLAEAYRAMGQQARAVEVWKQVAAIDPDQPEATRHLRQYYQ